MRPTQALFVVIILFSITEADHDVPPTEIPARFLSRGRRLETSI